jgi:hypothetical protein
MLKLRSWTLTAATLTAACHPSAPRLPWADHASEPPPAQHASVRTLNKDYSRERSHVLVREIALPTRAALDYAAYHANFMIAGEPPEDPPPPPAALDTVQPFGGLVDRDSLTADIQATALSPSERAASLAFAPLSEFLLASRVRGASALEELGSAVRSETWGGTGIPGLPSQNISEVYIHHVTPQISELWLKIEIAPWFRGLGDLPDPDRDGYPEVYGRASAASASPELLAALLAAIEADYASRVLNAAEIKTWANQLSSYWYPSFNTDLVPPGESWPDAQTEPEITQELAGLSVAAPSVVIRGKPQGRPTYAVLVLRNGKAAPEAVSGSAPAPAWAWTKTPPSPSAAPVAAAMQKELEQSGAASWQAWSTQLAPYANVVHKQLKSTPAAIKGVSGLDGFLFFRTALESSVAGELEQQPAGKNPLPVIVEWQRELARLGVDFLFVPVPAKEEIFPDKLDAALAPLVGKVVNPWERKLLASLAAQGVESLDLLAPLLAARAAQPESQTEEPLYQHQDTHWSARGLELAAQVIAARIEQYPWYAQLAAYKRVFGRRDASFTRFGDLHSRLPEAQKKKYEPETLAARQVVDADGKLYEDHPESPIVILGDSFTGVYQLTDAEHAGLSAHIAREIGYPVDLVMSYGGGPNVRHKLLRRGEEALAKKQLVVWVMADRDLHNYWEDWEPLHKP